MHWFKSLFRDIRTWESQQCQCLLPSLFPLFLLMGRSCLIECSPTFQSLLVVPGLERSYHTVTLPMPRTWVFHLFFWLAAWTSSQSLRIRVTATSYFFTISCWSPLTSINRPFVALFLFYFSFFSDHAWSTSTKAVSDWCLDVSEVQMCGREISSFPHVSETMCHMHTMAASLSWCLALHFFVILRWLSSLSFSSHTGEELPDSWPVVCETNTFPLITVAHRHIPSTLVASEIATGPLRGC